MTDQRDEALREAPTSGAPVASGNAPSLLSRRTVLRGATATVPTILTLASGSALARSSNLIGTIKNSQGDVLCLDPRSTNGATYNNPNVYDLGSPAYGEVTRIPTAHKYRNKGNKKDLTPPEVCKLNGTVEVKYNGSGSWRDKQRRNGVMVSNAAVASFGGRIVKTDI